MLSRRVQIALRALQNLAPHGPEFRPAREIARDESVPARFLDLILGELRQAGLVESARGPHGGYRLLPVADTMSVLDVLEVLGVDLAPLPCLERKGRRCGECSASAECSLRSAFEAAFQRYRCELAARRLSDLAVSSAQQSIRPLDASTTRHAASGGSPSRARGRVAIDGESQA